MREDLKFLIVGDTIIDEDIFLIASGICCNTCIKEGIVVS